MIPCSPCWDAGILPGKRWEGYLLARQVGFESVSPRPDVRSATSGNGSMGRHYGEGAGVASSPYFPLLSYPGGGDPHGAVGTPRPASPSRTRTWRQTCIPRPGSPWAGRAITTTKYQTGPCPASIRAITWPTGLTGPIWAWGLGHTLVFMEPLLGRGLSTGVYPACA